MKLTNKHGLPDTIVNVLKRPEYSKGKAHLSVTQMINSPKIVALTKKFDSEIEQDVADMVWSLFGSAIHKVLEHGKESHHIVEERIHATVDGWRLSGAVDLQIKNEDSIDIRDYKTTSAWAVMNEKIEWEQQLNCYAWLVEKVKGIQVKSVGIIAIIRDWSRRDAANNPDYPQAPIKEIAVRLWPFDEREAYVKERIHAHAECEFAMETEADLPDCTPTEMWEKPASYAVMKEGNKRANYVTPTMHEAELALKELQGGQPKAKFSIIVRPGGRTRCESFCSVNTYCQQWRNYQESLNA